MSIYEVRQIKEDIAVCVPGSKSITNRVLLIAALADGTSTIRGASVSEDSKVFLGALKTLGFEISEKTDESGSEKVICITGNKGIIPVNNAEVFVGSAGTAARFITAMLAFSDGTYTIRASEQMSKRPMRELTETLSALGAEFIYLENEHHFPFVVKGLKADKKCPDKCTGNEYIKYNVTVNIDKSSQFLSALLLAAPMLDGELDISLTGNRIARSYVDITTGMMEKFGVPVDRPEPDRYKVGINYGYNALDHTVEPDVSAACYYYAMAAVGNGISACVKRVHLDSIQGDIRFLDVLSDMGCFVEDTVDGVVVTGPIQTLHGTDIDMSDFSDQVLTLAAIAPFADDKVIIRNVSHIRNQESDRLFAASSELKKLGIMAELSDDGITIYPGIIKPADIETYNDHRVAMSFAVTGTAAPGIRILNPECACKTFPDYFMILDKITEEA